MVSGVTADAAKAAAGKYLAPEHLIVVAVGDKAKIETVPNLRLRNGTDGLEPLCAGYPTATLCSVPSIERIRSLMISSRCWSLSATTSARRSNEPAVTTT